MTPPNPVQRYVSLARFEIRSIRSPKGGVRRRSPHRRRAQLGQVQWHSFAGHGWVARRFGWARLHAFQSAVCTPPCHTQRSCTRRCSPTSAPPMPAPPRAVPRASSPGRWARTRARCGGLPRLRTRRNVGSAARPRGANRVIRGGSWNNGARNVRAANRNDNDPASAGSCRQAAAGPVQL